MEEDESEIGEAATTEHLAAEGAVEVEDESEIGEAATKEHLAAEGAVEVEDESEIGEAATTEHPEGTVEVEEEKQSQIDEARKPLAKLREKRKRSDGDRDPRPAKKANFIDIQQEEFEVKDEYYNLQTSAPPGSYEAVVEQLRNLYKYAVDPPSSVRRFMGLFDKTIRQRLGGSLHEWLLYAIHRNWDYYNKQGVLHILDPKADPLPIRNHIKSWEECLKFSMDDGAQVYVKLQDLVTQKKNEIDSSAGSNSAADYL